MPVSSYFLLNFLLPGAGTLLYAKPFRGLLILLTWSLFMLFSSDVYWQGFISLCFMVWSSKILFKLVEAKEGRPAAIKGLLWALALALFVLPAIVFVVLQLAANM